MAGVSAWLLEGSEEERAPYAEVCTHDNNLHCASATADCCQRGREPGRSHRTRPGESGAREACGCDNQPPQELTVHALLPDKQHKDRVYPPQPNSVGRGNTVSKVLFARHRLLFTL